MDYHYQGNIVHAGASKFRGLKGLYSAHFDHCNCRPYNCFCKRYSEKRLLAVQFSCALENFVASPVAKTVQTDCIILFGYRTATWPLTHIQNSLSVQLGQIQEFFSGGGGVSRLKKLQKEGPSCIKLGKFPKLRKHCTVPTHHVSMLLEGELNRSEWPSQGECQCKEISPYRVKSSQSAGDLGGHYLGDNRNTVQHGFVRIGSDTICKIIHNSCSPGLAGPKKGQ